MKKLTKEQAQIIGAFTGVLCGKFSDLHEYIEKIAGRPVYTHEMADSEFTAKIKEKVKADFIKIANQD